MENQENPETRSNDQQVSNDQPQDQKPKKEKNPKRVAAGKKGAEARWKQKQQEAPQEQEAPQDTVTRVTRKPETESTLKVNVYKNYFPLCAVLIGVVGLGIYMSYNKPVPATVTQPPPQQSTPDPFEMN